MSRLYFDFNATTPLSIKSTAAIQQAFTLFANPSGRYQLSNDIKAIIKNARVSVAQLLGGAPEQILFTSGGTESNNLALHSVLSALPTAELARYHAISSSIEHPSVLATLRWFQLKGLKLTLIDPEKSGRISLQAINQAMTPQTCLIALMAINNETGVVQPYEALISMLSGTGVHLHIDAVQAIGKWPFSCKDLNNLTVAFSGHKFNAPKGIGGLYYSPDVVLLPLLQGGGQEQGLRSGTENTLGIAGLAAAAEEAYAELDNRLQHYHMLKDHLLSQLDAANINYLINGESLCQLQAPWTLNISILGIRAEALASRLDLCHGISVSLGSACSNNHTSPQRSHVLLAMQLPDSRIDSALRISFGYTTNLQAIKTLAHAITLETHHLLKTVGDPS